MKRVIEIGMARLIILLIKISERKIQEGIALERSKLKEMLSEYSIFIDKVLQEKMELTQRCDQYPKQIKELEIKLLQKEEVSIIEYQDLIP